MSKRDGENPWPPDQVITIVSGLPRSGTSMLMQMLEAGGMPLLVDAERAPDAHNPRGYFEYAPAKRLKRDASWLPEARGRAVKIVSHFLAHLPDTERYAVIFLKRDLDEVITSQRRMLRAQGQPEYPGDDAEMRRLFARHLAHAEEYLRERENFRVLYIDHRIIVNAPRPAAQAVRDFLGVELNLDAMAAAVDARLYHERNENRA